MDHSVFAVELCLRLEPVLLDVLRRTIADPGPALGLQQKWQQYNRATTHLLAAMHLAERGCWDYFDDDAKARRDYDMWVNGMLTEEGARREPSAPADPYRAAPRYLTFTMAMLIAQGSPTDLALSRICAVPEAQLWNRDVFARILRGMGNISFASVKSDVMYLIPRDEGWGLTAEDLADPKFHYLRMLVG